jgi:DNA-binding response OmpR family regulator
VTEGSRVLVVDDEVPLAKIVASYLEREEFTVALAHDGPSAVEAIRRDPPDLVVLDVMLPGFDGIEVCRQIRSFTDCYVIMLTARDEEVDKVVGLSMGADDYLVKPFSPRELVARVRAMLRRPRALATGPGAAPASPGGRAEELRMGDLVIDPPARKAWLGTEDVDMTRTEFDLLVSLAQRPRMAFTRRQLIDDVWGPEWYGDEHIVDVHVGHLRRKLDDDAADPRYIRTVRGVGYGMVTDP